MALLQPYLDTAKFSSGIDALNTYYNAHTTDFYTDFIRFACKIQPSAQNVAMYVGLLEHAAWRNMKAGQLTTPDGLPNPDLEMFVHFVMLCALGASDADLRNVYTTITTTEPKLAAGAFSSITLDRWRSYRDWLSSGLLDAPDLNVAKFDATVLIPNPSKHNAAAIPQLGFHHSLLPGPRLDEGTAVGTVGSSCCLALPLVQHGGDEVGTTNGAST